jgi:4-amino-4-deoxy-L-arabinose transferase-like glycosyltransferase
MLFLLRYLESDDLGSFVLAAVCYSLAALTKSTAALLAPTIGFAMVQRAYERGGGTRQALGAAAVRAGVFFLLCLILTFPWFYTAWRTWGTPFYNAGEEGISRVHTWWIFLKSRPWYTYPVSIPVMVPLYLLGFYGLATVVRRRAQRWEWLLAVWFLSFLVVMMVVTRLSEQLGPDSRYMLPAYPPLAILTAAQIQRLSRRVPAPIARWTIAGALLLCGAWSFRLTDVRYAQFPGIYHNFLNMPF